MEPVYYGLSEPYQLYQHVTFVCEMLGHGKHNMAVNMLMETAAVETHSGQMSDRHVLSHGVGVFQMDRIGFDDVQARVRNEDRVAVLEATGFDVYTVQYEWLAASPLLAAIFCRLFYKLKPEVFPVDREKRAEYWKTHYNTQAGKGSAGHYLMCCSHFGVNV